MLKINQRNKTSYHIFEHIFEYFRQQRKILRITKHC